MQVSVCRQRQRRRKVAVHQPCSVGRAPRRAGARERDLLPLREPGVPSQALQAAWLFLVNSKRHGSAEGIDRAEASGFASEHTAKGSDDAAAHSDSAGADRPVLDAGGQDDDRQQQQEGHLQPAGLQRVNADHSQGQAEDRGAQRCRGRAGACRQQPGQKLRRVSCDNEQNESNGQTD